MIFLWPNDIIPKINNFTLTQFKLNLLPYCLPVRPYGVNWCGFDFNCLLAKSIQLVLKMSVTSKHRKVKSKHMVQELKIVHSISWCGAEKKAKVVKTPWHESQQAMSLSRIKQSFSSIKHLKLDGFEDEVFLSGFEGPEGYPNRRTLVFLLPC